MVILNSFMATNSETYSIADFPAVKVADDKGDGWYLPALNELQYLYCAFKGAAPMTWQNNTPIGLVEDPDAADKFNTALDTAGVVSHWTYTEAQVLPINVYVSQRVVCTLRNFRYFTGAHSQL